jgi:hypothetical protein
LDARRHTIGSCGTGRAEIPTVGSAATPPAFIVQEIWLLEIQVMYCDLLDLGMVKQEAH